MAQYVRILKKLYSAITCFLFHLIGACVNAYGLFSIRTHKCDRCAETYIQMYRWYTLYGISKILFEIPHKWSNPYIERWVSIQRWTCKSSRVYEFISVFETTHTHVTLSCCDPCTFRCTHYSRASVLYSGCVKVKHFTYLTNWPMGDLNETLDK